MNIGLIVAAVVLCFIPLVACFVALALLVKGFKVLPGLLSVFLGLVAIVPIAAVQFLMQQNNFFSAASLGALLLEAIVINGLVEEAFKMFLICLIPSKKVELPVFFSYSILMGLALGCFETIIYLISDIKHIELRFFTAVVIHVCCSGLSGLFVYTIKNKFKPVHFMAFIMAVVLHGVYNYLAGFPQTHPIYYFSIAVVLFAIVECRIRYRAVKEPVEDSFGTGMPVQ